MLAQPATLIVATHNHISTYWIFLFDMRALSALRLVLRRPNINMLIIVGNRLQEVSVSHALSEWLRVALKISLRFSTRVIAQASTLIITTDIPTFVCFFLYCTGIFFLFRGRYEYHHPHVTLICSWLGFWERISACKCFARSKLAVPSCIKNVASV